jgi:hypothetical protein
VRVGDARARTASDRRDAAFASLEALAKTGSQEFARVARQRGLRLTFKLRRGVHDAPYLRQGLREFVEWGPFKAVAERPSRWTHKTVAVSGNVFGFRFSFAEPPDTLITFRRSGGRLSASGSGTVAIRTPDGRRFTATVPFSRGIGAA